MLQNKANTHAQRLGIFVMEDLGVKTMRSFIVRTKERMCLIKLIEHYVMQHILEVIVKFGRNVTKSTSEALCQHLFLVISCTLEFSGIFMCVQNINCIGVANLVYPLKKIGIANT